MEKYYKEELYQMNKLELKRNLELKSYKIDIKR